MGNLKALYAIPKDFKYYEEHDGVMSIGRGNYQILINYLNKNGYEYEEKDKTTRTRTISFTSAYKSRGYQEGDKEIICQNKNGIIKLGTGYGKTIIATFLVEILATPTLIIVPRDHLIKQFIETFKNCSLKTGIIQGSKEDIRDITIASIQTLALHPEIALKYQNYFGMVIVDECHTSITKKRLNVIQMFNPYYLYGMTATPRRTDQQSKALEFTYGPIIIDKKLPQKDPVVKIVYTNCDIYESYNYHEIIDSQIECEKRNQLIIDKIYEELKEGRKILVLTKRIKHYRKIYSMLSNRKTFCISSETKTSERAMVLEKMRDGTLDFEVIFGTYSMLSTGTDIPALDTLFFAGDLRSDVLQEQSSGRILRLFGNKRSPKIVDFIDEKSGILCHQGKARVRWYKKQGWEII